MTVKTIFICDKCGNEQLDANQFWTVGVTANHATYATATYVEGKSLQVCRPCLESFGIHVHVRHDELMSAPPSVEDLIRQILALCS
jgi:hypothetical protein